MKNKDIVNMAQLEIAQRISNAAKEGNTELFEALALIEKERGIPVDFMLTQIQKAIVTACKNTYGGNEDVFIKMEPDTGIFEVFLNEVSTIYVWMWCHDVETILFFEHLLYLLSEHSPNLLLPCCNS